MRPDGMIRPQAIFTAFLNSLLGLFDSSCFASFSQVLVAGFGITCPVRFLEVDGGSTRPNNRGQFGDDGDECGQIIAGL